jgi:hypothetical protein
MTLRELMTAMIAETPITIASDREWKPTLIGVPVEVRYCAGPRWLVTLRRSDMNVERWYYDLTLSPTADPLDAELR